MRRLPLATSFGLALAAFAVLAFVASSDANAQARRNSPRVAPPKFDDREVARIFFKDVFSEGLVGTRPSDLSVTPMAGGSGASGSAAGASGDGGAGGVVVGDWKSFLAASVIEDEIKATKLKVDEIVATPSKWNGGGYLEGRTQFSVAATMFGIISEYDGDVRWKKEAPYLRDVFSRSAGNAKVGTTQSFNEAKIRKTDLAELVGGGTIAISGEPEAKTEWGGTVDRAPLMQRIDIGQKESLNPAVANEAEFRKSKDKLAHEAAMFAAIAQILKQESMPDGTDESYVEFCDQLMKGSTDILDAVKLDSYDQARAAAGAIDQSCTACHELYRSSN